MICLDEFDIPFSFSFFLFFSFLFFFFFFFFWQSLTPKAKGNPSGTLKHLKIYLSHSVLNLIKISFNLNQGIF